MKKTSILYGLGSLLLFCTSSITNPSTAHNTKPSQKYYEGGCVDNWNQVPRDADYFQQKQFNKYYPSMPGNHWIKSTASSYSESGGGASHITKFTTKAGTGSFEPADGVLYKFNPGQEDKSIQLSIADPDKKKDNQLYIAVLINNRWKIITNLKTTGKLCYVEHSTKLPDEAQAVLLYTPKNNVDVYLGATCVHSKPSSTLPVAFYDVIAKRSTGAITWKVGDPSGVDSYQIEGSNDANNWVKVKTVEASGASSYTTVLTDTDQSSSLYLWLALALVPLGFIKTKEKRAKATIFCATLLLFAAQISCSKSDQIPTPTTQSQNLYKYYRVQSLSRGEIVETSKVITLE